MNAVAAARRGFVRCESCALLHRAAPGLREAACTRCGARLHARKPASLERTTAWLAAAAILYIPANLFHAVAEVLAWVYALRQKAGLRRTPAAPQGAL